MTLLAVGAERRRNLLTLNRQKTQVGGQKQKKTEEHATCALHSTKETNNSVYNRRKEDYERAFPSRRREEQTREI